MQALAWVSTVALGILTLGIGHGLSVFWRRLRKIETNETQEKIARLFQSVSTKTEKDVAQPPIHKPTNLQSLPQAHREIQPDNNRVLLRPEKETPHPKPQNEPDKEKIPTAHPTLPLTTPYHEIAKPSTMLDPQNHEREPKVEQIEPSEIEKPIVGVTKALDVTPEIPSLTTVASQIVDRLRKPECVSWFASLDPYNVEFNIDIVIANLQTELQRHGFSLSNIYENENQTLLDLFFSSSILRAALVRYVQTHNVGTHKQKILDRHIIYLAKLFYKNTEDYKRQANENSTIGGSFIVLLNRINSELQKECRVLDDISSNEHAKKLLESNPIWNLTLDLYQRLTEKYGEGMSLNLSFLSSACSKKEVSFSTIAQQVYDNRKQLWEESKKEDDPVTILLNKINKIFAENSLSLEGICSNEIYAHIFFKDEILKPVLVKFMHTASKEVHEKLSDTHLVYVARKIFENQEKYLDEATQKSDKSVGSKIVELTEIIQSVLRDEGRTLDEIITNKEASDILTMCPTIGNLLRLYKQQQDDIRSDHVKEAHGLARQHVEVGKGLLSVTGLKDKAHDPKALKKAIKRLMLSEHTDKGGDLEFAQKLSQLLDLIKNDTLGEYLSYLSKYRNLINKKP